MAFSLLRVGPLCEGQSRAGLIVGWLREHITVPVVHAADHALGPLSREFRAARLCIWACVSISLTFRGEVHVKAFNVDYDLVLIVWRAK